MKDAKFKLDERILLPRNNFYGKIKNICWLDVINTHQYLVEIENKKLYKMCFEHEMEKIYD